MLILKKLNFIAIILKLICALFLTITWQSPVLAQEEDIISPTISSGIIFIDDAEFSCADLVSHGTHGPYLVTVHAIDNVAIYSVILSYCLSGSASPCNYIHVPMNYIGGDYYRGEIPGQPYDTTILYYVTAYDSAGNFSHYEHPWHDPFVIRISPMITEPSITIRGEEYPLSDEDITVSNEGPYTVTARCNTATGVSSVVLNYCISSCIDESDYVRIPMNHVGEDYYMADIPEQPYGATILLYIEATCGAGHTEIREKSNNDPFLISIKPPPVLLVHGYCSDENMWGPDSGPLDFKQALEDQGFLVKTIELVPKPTNDSIWDYGSQLYGKIAQMKAAYKADQVDIVAHSLGGLAARAYAWQNSSQRDVRTLIMLGTPNNGSGLLSGRYWRFLRPVLAAYTLGLKCEGLGKAAHQMTPGSKFLRDLNSAGLQPSIENYYTIAGSKPVPAFSWISNWILNEPHDGVVEVASVQAIARTTNSVVHVNHFEYDDDTTVFAVVVNILRGATSSAATSIQVQQSGTDYQESALIEDSVGSGEGNDHSIPIDSTVSEVRFALASDGGELDFTLTTPGGTLIDPTVAASNPLITYTNTITTLIGYDVVSPGQGNWTAHVAISGTAPSEVSYAMLALLDSDLGLSILLDENIYSGNAPVPLAAQLMNASDPVTGATVVAQVESPDASTQTTSLYDDGSHGDAQANDGIYSNIYTNTITVGAYEVTVTAFGTMNDEQFARETAATIWVEQEEYRIHLPLIMKNHP